MGTLPTQEQLENIQNQFQLSFSREDRQFFLDWDADEIIYVNYDRDKGETIPPPRINKLVELGLVNMCRTCQEDIWYSVSIFGKAFQDFILSKKNRY